MSKVCVHTLPEWVHLACHAIVSAWAVRFDVKIEKLRVEWRFTGEGCDESAGSWFISFQMFDDLVYEDGRHRRSWLRCCTWLERELGMVGVELHSFGGDLDEPVGLDRPWRGMLVELRSVPSFEILHGPGRGG